MTAGRTSGPASGATSALQFRIPGDAKAVRKALAGIVAALGRMAIHGEALHALELVLAEVLNNIVEHAYDGTEGGVIEVEIDVTRSRILCHVTDSGAPMPDGALPAGCRPEVDQTQVEDLPEGGFGWFLIRSLTGEVNYRRRDGKNCLSFAIPLARGHCEG